MIITVLWKFSSSMWQIKVGIAGMEPLETCRSKGPGLSSKSADLNPRGLFSHCCHIYMHLL